MSKPAQRLGRGLSAILGPRTAAPPPQAQLPHPDASGPESRGLTGEVVTRVPLADIIPNPNQPRTTFELTSLEALAASIRSTGVLQPVIVRSIAGDRFELVAGERRWRAAQLAGLATIPALVKALTPAESLELALVENLQREDLRPLERARAYEHFLRTFGGTAEALAVRLGESRATVANHLRLLRLRPEVQQMIEAGQLSMGQARAIAGLEDATRQLAIAAMAVRRNLSVRQVESLVQSPVQPTANAATVERQGAARHMEELERSLTKALGLQVRIVAGKRKNSGRVVISYASLDDFDRLAERICGQASSA